MPLTTQRRAPHTVAALVLDTAKRQEVTQMQPTRLVPNPQRHNKRGTAVVRTLALAALAALSTAPVANGAVRAHQLRLASTMFAAQVGSTPTGTSVYAGAVVDPRLGHGAVVYSTNGTTAVRVTFHEYLPLGSITGTGRITVVPGTAGGPSPFTGALTVTGGTGAYRKAHGKLSATGTINSTGMTTATINGAVTY